MAKKKPIKRVWKSNMPVRIKGIRHIKEKYNFK